jgi:hypothetical protein
MNDFSFLINGLFKRRKEGADERPSRREGQAMGRRS